MSTIKLSNYQHGGVKTEIDGFELPEVTSIHFEALPGDVPRLTVGMLCGPLEVEIDANVVLNIKAFEGCDIVDITDHSVNKRFLIVRQQETPMDTKDYLTKYVADLRKRAEAVGPGPVCDLLIRQADEAQRLQNVADKQWEKDFGKTDK